MLRNRIKVTWLLAIMILTSLLMMAGFFYWKLKLPSPEHFNFPVKGLGPDPPKFLFSITGKTEQEYLDGPLAVTAGKEKVYVADSRNHRINVYDKKGNYLFSIGQKGIKAGQFIYPNTIALDSRENLYVGEFQNKRIQVFSSDGKYLKTLAGDQKTKLLPLDIVFHKDRLYVADRTGRVIILDLAGKVLKVFGQPGTTEGLLNYPNGIAVAEDGQIYVSDSGNARIQVFSPTGKFIRVLEARENPINLPRGLAFDDLGQLYVVDTFNHNVSVFDDDLTYLLSFGDRGLAGSQFNFPNDVFVDRDFHIYVADRENNRIAVFAYR